MRTIRHWIAGAETSGASTRFGPVYNPALGAQQAQVALAEPSDVDAAVQAAGKAFEEWREVSVTRRAKIMFAFRDLVERNIDRLAEIVADEHGKVLADARGEVIRGMQVAEYACGIPERLKGEYSEQVSTEVDAILDHPGVAAVSFVGSTPIARYVHGRVRERQAGAGAR